MNLNSIFQLYAVVLNRDIKTNKISGPEIRKGIQSMGRAYSPESSDFESTIVQLPDYNDRACRIAYLHKYAPLHTYIVLDTTLKILQANPAVFRDLLINVYDLKFCSIGGGPGSDVIGVITALQTVFGTFGSSITIIDYMKNWQETFDSIINELKVGPYCKIWNTLAYDSRLNFNYIGANMLCGMTNDVNKSIGKASLLTMIKFVSAAICTDTEEMVDKIFRVMKPGALVLYIDNAAGGFTQIVERAGRRNGLVPVYGPERHVTYEAEALKVERFGYMSCFKTKVTVILLQKLVNHQFINTVSSCINSNNHVPSSQQNPVNFIVLENNALRSVMDNSIPFPDWQAKNNLSVPTDLSNEIRSKNFSVSSIEPCNAKAKNISSQTIAPHKAGAKNNSSSTLAHNKTGSKKKISGPTIEQNNSGTKNYPRPAFEQNKVGTGKNNCSLPRAPEHSTSIHMPSTKVNNSSRYTQVPISDAESKTAVNYWSETDDNAGDTCCSCCVIS